MVELYFHVKQVAQLHLSLVVADVLIVFEDSVVGIGSFCRCTDGRLMKKLVPGATRVWLELHNQGTNHSDTS